jgi:hypothetical protein
MLSCRIVSLPIEQNHKLCANAGDPVDKEQYQRLVGRLIYLCHTRPDITHDVNIVSRYIYDPREQHMKVIRRILRYIKGSLGKRLWFKSNGHLRIEGYCDTDWTSYVDDHRFTTEYCVHVGGNLVVWRSKKQGVVARTSAEAEYRDMALSLCEMMWVKNLLSELRLFRGDPL